jgi:hypothetical protein
MATTTIRTRASMSQHWNGFYRPCTYALIGVDAVKARPAVDPASDGEIVT